jgi:pyruvate ferredoxin oxidoreductase gamma subunit
VQAFATYGGASRGTPVCSVIRVDTQPIRVRCDIERADAVLCFDATLLDGPRLTTVAPDGVVVVNSARPAAEFAPLLPGRRIVAVDGLAIARRHGLGRIVNSALLGGFACAIGAPGLRVLTRSIATQAPRHGEANVAACESGWQSVAEQLATVAA